MMQLHELIDRDDPRCLYCNSDCDLKQDGTPMSMMSNNHTYEVQSLTCRKCQEIFEIHWYETDLQVTCYYGFAFTCKDLLIFNMYLINASEDVEGCFTLGKRSKNLFKHHKNNPSNFPFRPRIPPFPVDFSDKNKLYEKLKTYLIFS